MTYVFVNKKEVDDLKASFRELQLDLQKMQQPKPVPRWHLGAAFVVLLIATISACVPKDGKTSLIVFVIGVVLAQACIDLYKGSSRPRWSAAFRLLALAAWYLSQLLRG